MQRRLRRFLRPCSLGGLALVVMSLGAASCGGGPPAPASDADNAPPPRSARAPAAAGPGLPEARPSPFQVELRKRDGAASEVLRVTDDALRYTVGKDPHDVTLLHPVSPETVDALYAALREHHLDQIDTRPNKDADVDGTSIRMLAGRRPASASRMGHFEPEPQYAADYDACVEAVRDVVPVATDGGVALRIEFDASMAERRASLELDLGGDLLGVTSDPMTVVVAKERTVTLKLRYGPPAKEITQNVDLSQHGGAVVRVDPELNVPVFELTPRGAAGDAAGGAEAPATP